MKNNNMALAALLALAACSLPASAIDSASVEVGQGNGVDMWRIGAQWKWQRKWLAGAGWHLGGYWDAQLGAWKGRNQLVDVGITPVFRFQESSPGRISPYLEAAIGFHLLSKKRIDSRRFGSAFQFGDHVGAGLRFGTRGRYDLSLRYQHLSNGGIRKPNPGINFTQLRFQLHFD
jgi:lipid A 3-O-deacylase